MAPGGRLLLVVAVAYDALACAFVPSTATSPTWTRPACAHNPSTSPNKARHRVLMALTEPGDGAVIRRLVGRDHATGDVLDARPLDRPRGPLAPCERLGRDERGARLLGPNAGATPALGRRVVQGAGSVCGRVACGCK
jgi:hypothetical protein